MAPIDAYDDQTPSADAFAMYKHILVPTDGSKLSDKAIKHAAGLANAVGAKVTLLHVAPEQIWPVFAEGAAITMRYTKKEFQDETRRQAERTLDAAARRAGMAVETRHVLNDLPYDAIVTAAAKFKCDLIVMASHGRKGVAGFLLGSETQKVLSHSKIPVLVVR